jgi:hypothetical protein
MTISLLLLLVAFGLTVASAIGRAPLWAAVFVVVVTLLLQHLPIR